MGFCILNNVAVAVKELMRLGLAKKVMILDWDVHHGNGTQKVFEEDQNVLFISIHRHDRGTFYPSGFAGSPACVGADPAKGFSINIGWNGPGYTDADYLAAFYRVVMPIAMEFSPDFIFVSAGFDAADGDPIGECLVTPRGFAQMTQLLLGVAAGRVLLVLEGGYNIPVISSCAEACTRTLLGDPIPLDTTTVRPTASLAAMAAIDETINFQSDYWKSLYPRYYNVPERASGVFTIQRRRTSLCGLVHLCRCKRSFVVQYMCQVV